MVKKVLCYQCEKCGCYISLKKEDVEEHEKMQIKGEVSQLENLLFFSREERFAPYEAYKDFVIDFYTIIRRGGADRNHNALYKEETVGTPDVIWTSKERLVYDLISTLNDFGRKNFELSEKEFQEVSARLKQKYPERYQNIQFKRKFPLELKRD